MQALAGIGGLLVVCGLVLAAPYAVAPLMLFAINGKLARLIAIQERIATQLESRPHTEAAPMLSQAADAVPASIEAPAEGPRHLLQRGLWLLGGSAVAGVLVLAAAHRL